MYNWLKQGQVKKEENKEDLYFSLRIALTYLIFLFICYIYIYTFVLHLQCAALAMC